MKAPIKLSDAQREAHERNLYELLKVIDEDPNREGLKETPKRFLKFMTEFCSQPEFNFKTFTNEGMDEMIVMTKIKFSSLCEHHIAPFVGTGVIAYIPDKKIVGLSKLPRTLDYFSRRLQNQERITNQVADFINDKLNPKGVAVILKAEHFCMKVRGAKQHEAMTTTSCMKGAFKEDSKCRAELFSIIGNDLSS